MPYLTPDELPESADCRTLLIPASSDWLAIVSGALTELVKTYNWQQFGAVTVDEAVAAMQAMIDTYYNGCTQCLLPGGSPLFRIGRTGRIEQLVNDEWVEPEGDYELPPTPARGEATPDERRCLAAANAAAVLEQLYEEISDAFQEGMTFQQWAEFLTATLITLLGTIFGLVIAPLVLIGVLIVGVIYEVLEFITADVWTSEFTDMLECLLYECASDTAGDVVHFDYNCLMNKLASVTNIFDPTFAEIRLFGQISFIFQFIGAQSLDAMGATTGVSTADCDDCGEPCAFYLNGDGLKDMTLWFDTTHDVVNDWLLSDTLPAGAHYSSFTVPYPNDVFFSFGITALFENQSAAGSIQLYGINGSDFGDLDLLGDRTGIGNGENSWVFNLLSIPPGYDGLYVTLGSVGGSSSVTIKAVSICRQ